jgi:hypothetical protein
MSDKPRCAEKVWSGFGAYQCSRAAKLGGYCKQHNPENVAARRKARQEAWDAQWDAEQAAREAAKKQRERERRALELLPTAVALAMHSKGCDIFRDPQDGEDERPCNCWIAKAREILA